MARKKTTKVVTFSDGEERRFRLRQMKVRDGHAVLERLMRVAAPILGALAENLGEDDPEKAIAGDLSVEGLTAAVDKLAANLLANEGIVDWLTEKLRKYTEIETESEDVFVSLTSELYDDTFAGEYGAEAVLIAAHLKANYGSLFKGAGGLAGAARRFVTPRQSRSSSPEASPSGSGAS